MRHSIAFVACLALAACPGPTTTTNTCGTSEQTCTTTTDCCANFICSAGLCTFVGGNGNGNGNGTSGNGGGSSSGGCTGLLCHGTSTGGATGATTTGGANGTTGGVCGVVGVTCGALASCCTGLICQSGSCVESTGGTTGGLCGGATCNYGESCMNGACACDSSCTGSYSCNGADRCIQGQCVQGGGSCTQYSDCCSGDCAAQVCSSCSGQGGSCASGGGCCEGLSCYDGVCGVCQQDDTSCTSPGQCCSDICDQGTCEACHTAGDTCGTGTDCCSGLCSGGTCQISTADMCKSCTTDASCSLDNYCVELTEGSFVCVPDCLIGTSCPSGTECEELGDQDGDFEDVCAPSSGSCSSTSGTTGGSTTGGTASGGTTGGTSGSCPSTVSSTEWQQCPTTACATGLSCVADTEFTVDVCEYPCTSTADCPDYASKCGTNGYCTINTCTDYGGTCPAESTADGTCIAWFEELSDGGYEFLNDGICYQGGTATTCDGTAAVDPSRCPSTSALCAPGWACTSSDTCVELCEPSGTNTCPSGDTCDNVDGEDGECE